MTFALWNVRGLEGNAGCLEAMHAEHDVLVLTETWVAMEARPPLLAGYTCFALSRPFQHQNARRAAGGIACYVKDHLSPHVAQWRAASDGSLLWLKISKAVGMHKDLYLCAAYLCPESSTFYQNPCAIDAFDTLLADVAEIECMEGDVLLAGDFNARTGSLPDVFHPEDPSDLGMPDVCTFPELPMHAPPRASTDQLRPNRFGQRLLALCQSCNLLILNGRVRGDPTGAMTCHTPQGSSLVDYFISTPAVFDLKPSLHVHEQSPDSDHSMIVFTLPLSNPAPACAGPQQSIHRPVRFRYRPNRADAFCELLQQSLSFRMHPSEVLLPSTLLECIVSAASHSHGHVTDRPHHHKHQPWYDDECKALRRHLRSLHTHSPERKSAEDAYKRMKRSKKRQAFLKMQKELCEQACSNTQAFWRRYRRRGDVHNAITPQEWHSAFKELYGPEAGLDAVMAQGQPQGENADLNAPVTLDEVKAAFKRLKRNKAAGTDGIRAEFLLDAVDVLLQPLAQVFTHMLMNGVPSDWCKGIIHPIFKAGDVNDPGNYRGITVTPVLSKLFAMILEARMSSWAEQCDIRAAGQAGFRKDHRTTDNVFIIHTLVAQARRSHRKLYCCFVDFKKAFDSVPRHTLWQVLAELGINGNILDSLKSMYAQDEACVMTQEGLTEAFRCTAGVKQGCPASPLLFGALHRCPGSAAEGGSGRH